MKHKHHMRVSYGLRGIPFQPSSELCHEKVMLLHPKHEVILNLRVLDGLKQHAEACRLGNEGERGNRDEEDDFATSPLLLVSPILLLSACVWCTRCTQKASGDLSVLRTQSEKHTFSCCVTPQCVTKSRIRANSHPS